MDDLDWSGIDVRVPMADIEYCGICFGVTAVVVLLSVLCALWL